MPDQESSLKKGIAVLQHISPEVQVESQVREGFDKGTIRKRVELTRMMWCHATRANSKERSASMLHTSQNHSTWTIWRRELCVKRRLCHHPAKQQLEMQSSCRTLVRDTSTAMQMLLTEAVDKKDQQAWVDTSSTISQAATAKSPKCSICTSMNTCSPRNRNKIYSSRLSGSDSRTCQATNATKGWKVTTWLTFIGDICDIQVFEITIQFQFIF